MATLFWTRILANVTNDGLGHARASVGHMDDGWTVERIICHFHIETRVGPALDLPADSVRGLCWGIVKLNDSFPTPAGNGPGTSPGLDWLVSGLVPPHYRVLQYGTPAGELQDATQWYNGPAGNETQGRRRNDEGEGQTFWWLANLDINTLFPAGEPFGSVWCQILLRVP